MKNYDVIRNLEHPLADIMDATTKEINKLRSEDDEELAVMYEALQQSLDIAQSRMVDIQVKIVRRTISANTTEV